MSYQVMEIERTDEHCDDPTKDETSIAVQELLERIAEADEEARKAIETAMKADLAAKTASIKIVCSCGFTRCGLIGRFGHPVPVFKAEIQPIPSQYARDMRALALKGQGGF